MRPLSSLMSADLVECDTCYQIHADMPGRNWLTIPITPTVITVSIVGCEDVEITTDDNVLTIQAKRCCFHEETNDIMRRTERSTGNVKRSIALPSNCDGAKANAVMKDGVLTVTFPKRVSSTFKKIPIQN